MLTLVDWPKLVSLSVLLLPTLIWFVGFQDGFEELRLVVSGSIVVVSHCFQFKISFWIFFPLGDPVAFQPILRRIQFMRSRYVKLVLVVLDPFADDSIGPDFPLRSKFVFDSLWWDFWNFSFLGILFNSAELFAWYNQW